MSTIPYKFYKVEDINQVDNTIKTEGSIIYDDTSRSVYVYGAQGIPVIYGSRRWEWDTDNSTSLVKDSNILDIIVWTTKESIPIVGKEINDTQATITTMIGQSFIILTFYSTNSGSTWEFSNSQYYTPQEEISDLDTIRTGAAAGATALQTIPSKYTTTYTITALQGTMNITTYNNLISNKFVTFAPTSISGLSITTGNRIVTSSGAIYSAVYRDIDTFKLLECTFTISGTIVRYVVNLYALDIAATQIVSV